MKNHESVGKEITSFIAKLANESERASVVMAVALTDECLESALQKLLKPAKIGVKSTVNPCRNMLYIKTCHVHLE